MITPQPDAETGHTMGNGDRTVFNFIDGNCLQWYGQHCVRILEKMLIFSLELFLEHSKMKRCSHLTLVSNFSLEPVGE